MPRILLFLLFASSISTALAASPAPPPPPAPAARSTLPATPPPAPQEKGPPLLILSIIPAQAEPGMVVTLSGSGFSEGAVVSLGATDIPATIHGPRLLSFEVPDIPPGLYALFVTRPDGTASRTYSFSIAAVKPVASDLSPDVVQACAAGAEREVTITGRNFRQGAQILFDGAAIRGRYLSPDSLAFAVPAVGGGLHQVQVKNPDGTATGVLGLMIDAQPEITSVSIGEDSVNAYNLIINGRNFQQGSTVVVMEESSLDQEKRQLTVDVKRMTAGVNGVGTQQDMVFYINCNRMVYQRFPYSYVPKNLKVQVLNPTGAESTIVSVSAP